jgi:hypothetical protein
MASGVDNNMSFFVPIILIFCAVRGLLLILRGKQAVEPPKIHDSALKFRGVV